MASESDRLRDALWAYAQAALPALLEAGYAYPDGWESPGWHPRGDGHFVLREWTGGQAGLHEAIERAHGLREYGECMSALRSHPVLAERLDQMVGSVFGGMRLDAARIPDRVIYELLKVGAVDRPVFDEHYPELVDSLVSANAVQLSLLRCQAR